MTAKMNVVGGATMAGGKLAPYVADKGDPGGPGPASTVPGPEGDDGWTPVLAGTLTKAGVQIKVEAPNILTAVLGLLVGATVFVIAIEQ
jgi:hypothetical protein